jgi:hypothetical protein
MLTCKNVVVINDEKTTSYQLVDYNRLYLDFVPTDKVENFGKTNKGKSLTVLADGKEVAWEGTRPVSGVTSERTLQSVDAMIAAAIAQLVADYGKDKDYKDLPAEIQGKLLLLHAADYGRDLWVRAALQSANREVKALDPAKAIENTAKAMVAEWKSRGKVISLDDAKIRVLAMQLVEDAEAEGNELSMKEAIAQVKEQMSVAV